MQPTTMHISVEIARFIAQAIITGLWQGPVLIVAVGIFLHFMSRLGAAVRFALWGLAFTLAATLPLMHLPAGTLIRPHVTSAVMHLGAEWGFAIAAFWLTLMLVRGTRLLMHAVYLRRVWKGAEPAPAEPAIHALLQSGPRAAELCTSEDVDSPSVIGFFSPRLLIPAWLFAELAPSELRHIVLHECEHLRRYDDWINLLQQIGLVLFPLNPALFWLNRRLGLERELACDASVVASTEAPFDYARCLTRLAEHHLYRRSVALSLSAWGRQSELTRRVHNLLRPPVKISRLQARFSVAMICAGLIAGAVEMARFPHLFSFTDATTAALAAPPTGLAPIQANPRALPVVYHPTAQAHPTLLKAVLPVRSVHRTRAKMRSAAPLPTAHIRKAVHSQPQFLLTTFTVQRALSSNYTAAVSAQSARFSSSYAAVQFNDGWLIIQL